MEKSILSICIPCYGRVKYVRETLRSIYIGNNDVALDEFEVVISDNDPNQEVFKLTEEFSFDNLHYYIAECDGFMNSYNALTYGKGDFLKLHNSQVLFNRGALRLILDEIHIHAKDRTLIFYSNGMLRDFSSRYFESFDDFMFNLSYWSSWSNGIAFWREDFEQIKGVSLNELFPHTSLLLSVSKKERYCINDNALFKVQSIPKRGGHNKFAAFTIEYPSLITKSFENDSISYKSKKRILDDIQNEYLPSLVFNNYILRSETFDSSRFKENFKIYFPANSFYKVFFLSLLVPFRLLVRRWNMFFAIIIRY